MTITLFRNKIFLDGIKDLCIGSFWIIWYALNPMTSTLIQKRRSHRHRKELEKAMWNWQQKVELYSHKLRNACKRQYRFFLMAFGGQATLPTPWFQTSGLQTNEIFNSFYFKPLSLQWFGTSALRNRMVNWIQCLRQICSSGRGQGSCLYIITLKAMALKSISKNQCR